VGLVTVEVSPPRAYISDHYPDVSSDILQITLSWLRMFSVMADDTGAFTTATTVEPEIGTTHLPLFKSQPREEPKTLDDSDAPTMLQRRITFLDRPTSPDVALIQHPQRGSVRKDNYGAVAVASTLTAIYLPFPQQPQGQDDSASDEEGDDE